MRRDMNSSSYLGRRLDRNSFSLRERKNNQMVVVEHTVAMVSGTPAKMCGAEMCGEQQEANSLCSIISDGS